MEVTVILVLLGLNVFQAVFWSYQCQRLVNKLMSRNYAEYVSIQKPIEEKPAISRTEYEEALEEKDILEELNGMFKTR